MVFPELGDQPFYDAGEIIVASDPKAIRPFAFVRRNAEGNVELLSRRDGPVDKSYTLRECKETGPLWRYLAEGDSLSELAKNLSVHRNEMFSGLSEDSIADVTVKHALSAMREIEISARSKG